MKERKKWGRAGKRKGKMNRRGGQSAGQNA